jgi:hypothetical protein
VKFTRISLFTLAVAGVATSALAQQARVPVYVFTSTDPSGFVDADTKALIAFVTDVREQLQKSKSLTKIVEVVDTPESATIRVEITGITKAKGSNTLAMLANSTNAAAGGLAALRPRLDEEETVTIRHAVLSVGAYSTELTTEVRKNAIPGRIAQWVKDNREQLPAVDR